jgi:uncharacterized protein YeaO (DUF488 family)
MPVFVVRLGSPRTAQEGLRLGTVRRPPRGVPKADFARLDYYDVWVPQLAPSQALLSVVGGPREVAAQWPRFERQFLTEMKAPASAQLLDLLAAMSHRSNFAVGCYCADESRCHRSLLRRLLAARGACLSA